MRKATTYSVAVPMTDLVEISVRPKQGPAWTTSLANLAADEEGVRELVDEQDSTKHFYAAEPTADDGRPALSVSWPGPFTVQARYAGRDSSPITLDGEPEAP